MSYKWIISVILGMNLLACGGEADRATSHAIGEAPYIAKFASFESKWPTRSPEEVAHRAHSLAELLVKNSLPMEPFLASARSNAGTGGIWKELSVGGTKVVYYPAFDDLRVSRPDERLESVDDLTRQGITESQALDTFHRTFEDLVAGGLIVRGHYNPEKAEIASVKFALGQMGKSGPASEAIVEYRFSLLRQINGLDFANAGVKVAVRTSGEVVELRIGGSALNSILRDVSSSGPTIRLQNEAAPTGLAEMPVGAGEVFDGTVSETAWRSRFASDYPRAKPDWSRLIYMLPMGSMGGAGIVEPLFVVSYSEVYQGIASRRRYAGYSPRSPDAAPVDLSEMPEPNAKGDARP